MAVTLFTWFLIAMLALLAIASVKIIIAGCSLVIKKFNLISGEKQQSMGKSVQVAK